ncbi:Zn(2)-C6 fungal-type domain-containing protein [Fusarium sp. Ph1]|nr:Zn(2)-C6 fungal-type domain-containing protein [Fusarium sp. Ph1]
MPNEVPSPNRRKARSKNGCLTCRIRKVKCDERRPVCERCANSPMKCEWLEPGKSLSVRRSRGSNSASRPGSCRSSPRPLAPSRPATPRDSPSSKSSGMQHATTPSRSNEDASSHSPENNNQQPQSTLSANHAPLANSLQLSADDEAAFLYIPESMMVLCYGKLWKWSCFSYIYTHIASQYSGVMRSLIAVASMELRAHQVLQAQESDNSTKSLEAAHHLGAAAAAHYSLALQDLSSLLHLICHSEGRDDDINALFTMWFLILRYEAYDSESTGASLVHLEGIRSFLRPYLDGDEYGDGKRLPYLSQTMLLYTLYLDADSATGNVHGGQLCMDFSSREASDYISHERLFLSVRSILPKIWGDNYPVTEILDDLENYRPLRLYHLCQGAKLELLRLARSATGPDNASLRRLWRHIQSFGDEFADILLLARQVPNSGGKRLMWTVYSAFLDFHALQVLYSCLHVDQESQSRMDSSLTQILRIASKALREDPRQTYRLMWSLSVALCKTQGHPDHMWLSAQLAKARVLLPNFGVPGLILGQCDGLQSGRVQ